MIFCIAFHPSSLFDFTLLRNIVKDKELSSIAIIYPFTLNKIKQKKLQFEMIEDYLSIILLSLNRPFEIIHKLLLSFYQIQMYLNELIITHIRIKA